MPGFRIPGFRSFAVASALAVLSYPCGPLEGQNQPSPEAPLGTQVQAPFQLKIASNLVVVRVVVRDAQGQPVRNLRKEDFRLFDKGHEQTITQFAAEDSVAPPAGSTAVPTPEKMAPALAPSAKFIALYFDNLNTSDVDMMQARDAADHYLAADLTPDERVAIFTPGQMLSDFTTDAKQIHDALSKLHASAQALSRVRDCPDLSDYQALQITQFEDDITIDAWKMALDQAIHDPACAGLVPTRANEEQNFIRTLARRIVDQSQLLARSNLQELERVVSYLSHMPGQRTVVLVSPGFMSQSEQPQLNQIIDHALRSQVVISSLDPKGLANLMREGDASQSYVPTIGSGGPVMAVHNQDSQREFVATDVLAEVAEGTGGEFFHNNNDLKAGFGALTASSLYYILAFTPSEMKLDGRFHQLKVALANKPRSYTIQSRRGYFAPKNEAEAQAEVKKQQVSDAEAEEQEQIREAIFSKTRVQDFPVALRAKVSTGQGDIRELSLLTHMDATPLHFHREGVHSLNTVTFTCAIFDQKTKLVGYHQGSAEISLLDAQLPGLLNAGLEMDMIFQLKPGIYKIREVVSDSEEHHMAAFSHDVKIP